MMQSAGHRYLVRAATGLAALFITFCAVHVLGARADESLFDPATGYRITRFRAPAAESVEGAKRIDRDELDKLLAAGAVLLDVMPAEGAGPDPATGHWRLLHPHASIPGAVWLPETGRPHLSPAQEAYLFSNVERLANGQRTAAIVVFCQADCWMSWNAVRRLAHAGYSNLYWYPEGTDGWVEWGDRKLVPVDAVPLLPTPKDSTP